MKTINLLSAIIALGLFDLPIAALAQRPEIALPTRGLCAHRGDIKTCPENTLPAFRKAIRCGAQMIEFDVYLTKDKALVVIHDPTVDRTTNGKGRVSDLTLEEIRRLDAGSWKNAEFAGEKVPTLLETLELMPANIWLNVHLKGDEELGRRVAEVIVQVGRVHQAFLACGEASARGAKAVAPRIMICNMTRKENPLDYVNDTIAAKMDFIQLERPISGEFKKYTAALKEHSVRINYYGTDVPAELWMLFDFGIEFPLVNDIAGSMKAAEEFGIRPVRPIYFK